MNRHVAFLLCFTVHSILAEVHIVEGGPTYSSAGKRDPFRAPAAVSSLQNLGATSGLLRFTVDQFQLRAVLRSDGVPRALFEDPEGNTHIVTEGDRMGREGAKVSRIVNSEVIITQETKNYLGQPGLLEKVISLPQERSVGEIAVDAPPTRPAPMPNKTNP